MSVQGNEMETNSGRRWEELEDDKSLQGDIFLHQGDEVHFITRRETASSTACQSIQRFEAMQPHRAR